MESHQETHNQGPQDSHNQEEPQSETKQTQENTIPPEETKSTSDSHDKKDQTSAPPLKKETMKAVFLEDIGKPLVIKEIPIPKPQSGEVLIKIEAAPINPSDLELIKGSIIKKAGLPCQAGFEGAGTIITSGGGLMGRALMGKRVSFGCSVGKGGTWAEYTVTPASYCFPLEKKISFEEGACAIVNPFTAIAFAEIITKEKRKAIVQTAAASQLGRMIVKILKKEGVKTINIVRKEEQKKLLEDLGADVVLNSEDENFEEELRKKAEELQATCLLECVCGDVTHKVIRAMPSHSVCYLYGHLDNEELTKVDFMDMLVNYKTIKPFNTFVWLEEQGIFTKLNVARKVQKFLSKELKSQITKTFDLEQINEALEYYKGNMTEGKILIKANYTEKKE